MKRVEFWFELASTYSYPAAWRVAEVAASSGVEVVWRPFLLGPIFHAQGWNDSPFNIYPAKGSYMWRDLERICARLAIPFRRPSQFPRNGLRAARVACCLQDSPVIGELVRQMYRANFGDDRDIAEPAVIAALLAAQGLPATVLADAESPDNKARLRSQTERAQALGIFGAPTFVVDGELFWGNDRLEDALAWAQERQGSPH